MIRCTGSPVQRLRARSSVACFGLYALLSGSFWIAGALAFWRGGSGAGRLLGVLFLPSLALPVVGRGELAGVPVDSVVWWWWFAAQAAVAALAIWLYPYDRVPRTGLPSTLGQPRLPASVG
jgi:hypothetical protein